MSLPDPGLPISHDLPFILRFCFSIDNELNLPIFLKVSASIFPSSPILNFGSPGAIFGWGEKFLLDKLYHKLIYFDD